MVRCFLLRPLSVVIVFGNIIPMIVLGPFLWATYFLFIPKIRKTWLRIALASIISSIHVIAGWREDSAFTRAVSGNLLGLLVFGLLATIGLLVVFAVRGVTVSKETL
jgi:hypothetical protein